MMWAWEAYGIVLFCVVLMLLRFSFWRLMVAGFFVSGLRVFVSPLPPFRAEDPAWVGAFDRSAGSTISLGALYVMSAFSAPALVLDVFFDLVALVNALWILIGGFFFHAPYGVLLNASMSGCFAVALIPHLCRGKHWPPVTIILSAAAALVAAQSQPVGLFFLLLTLVAFQEGAYLWACLPIIALPFIGQWITNGDLYKSSGRFGMWAIAMGFWRKHCDTLLGAGAGAFAVTGPYFSRHLTEQFIWLHSDWLQILFEQGVIGLVLSVGFFIYLMVVSKREVQLSVGICGAWMLANMPFHYPLSALYLVYVMRKALAGEHKSPSSSLG